jgi:hypothetical protein
MKIVSRTTRKINGNWYARVRYEDDNGKKGELLRGADGKSDAENLKAKLVTELLEKGPPQLVAGKVTFRQLVQHAKDNIYVPAVFEENGTRIKGVKSEKTSALRAQCSGSFMAIRTSERSMRTAYVITE